MQQRITSVARLGTARQVILGIEQRVRLAPLGFPVFQIMSHGIDAGGSYVRVGSQVKLRIK